jgi:hypothetical protein
MKGTRSTYGVGTDRKLFSVFDAEKNMLLPYNVVRRVTSNCHICDIWVCVKNSGRVECGTVSLGEWISTLPSQPRATTQQLTLRHILEDLNLKPSDLFNHLAEKLVHAKPFWFLFWRFQVQIPLSAFTILIELTAIFLSISKQISRY